MIEILTHLLETNRKYILANSVKDCHVKGLHSIALSEDCDGRMIRMFLHEDDGSLYFRGDTARNDLPLAIHPHHCDLTLIALVGSFTNHLFKLSDKGIPFDKWQYDSKFDHGDGGFRNRGREILESQGQRTYNPDRPGNSQYKVTMKADQLHTVTVNQRDKSAWLVLEGAGDIGYEPFSYSNRDLTNVNGEGLYTKFGHMLEIYQILMRFTVLRWTHMTKEDCE